MRAMQRCVSCWAYTFRKECPECGSDTRAPAPPKFSPQDKYGKYRRMAKAKLAN